jgi:NAD(P)-dependent dehydrogenase (short-subunit alcohol dehydrogenase family)
MVAYAASKAAVAALTAALAEEVAKDGCALDHGYQDAARRLPQSPLRSSSGSLAMLAAMRRALARVRQS